MGARNNSDEIAIKQLTIPEWSWRNSSTINCELAGVKAPF